MNFPHTFKGFSNILVQLYLEKMPVLVCLDSANKIVDCGLNYGNSFPPGFLLVLEAGSARPGLASAQAFSWHGVSSLLSPPLASALLV